MGSEVKRGLRRYAICFLVWTALGLYYFSQALTQKLFSRDPTPWWHYLVSWMIGVWLAALLTPVIFWLGSRYPLERHKWLRRTLLHLALSLLYSLVQLTCESAILQRIGVFPTFMRTYGAALIFLSIIGFHQNVITYWEVLGVQYALRYYRRYQERQQEALRLELHASELTGQLARAQLSALKMQLQPHFLFNTLNAIMVLVRQRKGPEAEEMLARLSDLLRSVLEDVEAQEVPLRRELEYLNLYLAIEQVRFQDRLRVEIHADATALDAGVPQMGLQPVVENAIRHGIGKSLAAGKIEISAACRDGMLEIKVRDDGPGIDPGSGVQSSGIGLANTRARLKQLYGEAAKLTVANGEQGGAEVTIVLPYHAAGNSESELREMDALHGAHRR